MHAKYDPLQPATVPNISSVNNLFLFSAKITAIPSDVNRLHFIKLHNFKCDYIV